MPLKKKILIIDDDFDMGLLLTRFLFRNGYDAQTASSGNKGIEKVKEEHFDIVLCDYRLGDKEGKEVLIQIKNYNPDIIVLIMTGYSDIKTAVDVIKLGAYDYITKPLIPDEVLNVLKSALQGSVENNISAKTNISVTNKTQPHTENEFLIDEATTTKELFKQIQIVAPTDYSIILYGESGTGKEVMAKTIHKLSNRKNNMFVAMDCGTLSKELAGSELFGHVKGAFTGALNDKEGHFEIANGGTLFLDEVANLSTEVQALLLRVIQEKKFKRVGGTKEMASNVRIIVASNENLQELYKKGKFREDLYHRFNEFSINLPTLRNRKEDIPLFASFFLAKTNAELNKEIQGFEDNVMEIFMNYSWPGNLREFRNVVRRAALLTNGDKISIQSLPSEIAQSTTAFAEHMLTDWAMELSNAESDLKETAIKAEYDTIMQVLRQVKNNKTKAAKVLKIDRKTLYNKIKMFEEIQ